MNISESLETITNKAIYRVAMGEWPKGKIEKIEHYSSNEVGPSIVVRMKNGDVVIANIIGKTEIKYEAPREIDLAEDAWSIE